MRSPVRLIDIAAAVGVSKVTVSQALNPSIRNNTKISEATRKRICDVAHKMGYRVNLTASRLAGGHSRLLGILIDAHSAVTEFTRVAYVEEAAAEAGYRLLVGQCNGDLNNIRAYIDDFASRGIDGIIIHSNSFPTLNRQILEYSQQLNHVIFYDRPLCDEGKCEFVELDLASGIEMLIDHLVAQGRRKITYFLPYPPFPFGKYPSYLAREKGYMEGMRKYALEFDPKFSEHYLCPREPSIPEIVKFAREMLLSEKPDAVIARNDTVAGAVLRAMQELGITCPGDVALAGYDNRDFCDFLYPSLTTVDNRLPEVSSCAVRILLDRINGTGPETLCREYFLPKLIVRESTGPAARKL